jgi:DNA polymerase III psi subunit
MIDQLTTYSEELYQIKEKTTVVLTEPWEQVGEADRQLLQKILQSIRLNLASVRIVHQSTLKFNNEGRTIYFGAGEVKGEGLLVQAPKLSQLQNDPAGKQKLWVELKAMFSL